jgi:endonuclease/exonuclease/phosphatase family metal-dependent hydrolase
MKTTDRVAPASRVRARGVPVLHRPLICLLVLCGIWSVARFGAAERVPLLTGLLVPILAFTPYAALASVGLIGYAAALRRRLCLAAALAVTGALALAVLPRAIDDTAPAASGRVLRILTANLHLGQADPRVLVDLVRRSHADVLSMQEFTPEAAAALKRAGLGRLLPYRVAAPVAGGQGSAIYARYPLDARPMPPMSVTGLTLPRADVRVPGAGAVEVMAVHLARPMNPRGVGQWMHSLAWLPAGDAHGAVRIMAGDFNATLDHAPLRRLIGRGYVDAADATGGGLTPTFRIPFWPPITIDHVLADSRCAVRRTAVYDLPRSDHRALFAELRLP